MTEEERRERRRAKHRRYNLSAKGQERNRRYEAAHPERKSRWDIIMAIRARKPV